MDVSPSTAVLRIGSTSSSPWSRRESSGALDVVFRRLSNTWRNAELSPGLLALLYPASWPWSPAWRDLLLGFVIPRFATVLGDVGGTLPLRRTSSRRECPVTKRGGCCVDRGAGPTVSSALAVRKLAAVAPARLAALDWRPRAQVSRRGWPPLGLLLKAACRGSCAQVPGRRRRPHGARERGRARRAARAVRSPVAPDVTAAGPSMIAVGRRDGRLRTWPRVLNLRRRSPLASDRRGTPRAGAHLNLRRPRRLRRARCSRRSTAQLKVS